MSTNSERYGYPPESADEMRYPKSSAPSGSQLVETPFTEEDKEILRQRGRDRGIDVTFDAVTGKPKYTQFDSIKVEQPREYAVHEQAHTQPADSSTVHINVDGQDIVVERIQTHTQTNIRSEVFRTSRPEGHDAIERVTAGVAGAAMHQWGFSVPQPPQPVEQEAYRPADTSEYREAPNQSTPSTDPEVKEGTVLDSNSQIPGIDQDAIRRQLIGTDKSSIRAQKKFEKQQDRKRKLGIFRGIGVAALVAAPGFIGGYHYSTGENPGLGTIKTTIVAVGDFVF